LGNTGGYQQSKRSQEILDNDYNAGLISDAFVLKRNEEEDDIYKLSFGGERPT
jgi:hypothetical protein